MIVLSHPIMRELKLLLVTVLCSIGFSMKANNVDSLLALAEKNTTSHFEDAIRIANLGLEQCSDEQHDMQRSKFYQAKGLAYYFKGKYDTATQWYFKAIEISSKQHHLNTLGNAYNLLARVCRKTKKLDDALLYYNQAMNCFIEDNDDKGRAMIYNESGVVFEYKSDYQEALKRYNISLEICKKIKDTVGIAYAYNFIAGVYSIQKKYDDAKRYLLQALKYNILRQDTLAMGLVYADICHNAIEAKHFDEAQNYHDTTYAIAIKMHYKELELNALLQLSTIQNQNNNSGAAFATQQKYMALKDSLFNANTQFQIEELNTKYQSSEKEKTIQQQQFQLSKKNYILVGLGLFLILAGLLAYLYYNRYKLKQQNILQSEILKQQDLATKAVIDAEERERKRIASDLHDGIGQLLTATKFNLAGMQNELTQISETQKVILEKAVAMVDESCKEVRNVSHQIMPNALIKYGLANAIKDFIEKIENKDLQVHLHASGLKEKLDANIETVIYRIIQECVNNVIKHSQASRLDISILQDKEALEITIEDNGVGFDTKLAKNADGIGLKNLKSRVHFLRGSIEIDSQPQQGTLIALYIPLV